MPKAHKQRLVAEINITPFTDVILVLLVIFMITTPLLSQSNIKVKLPKAKSGTAQESGSRQQVTITVTNEGLVYLDKDLVTRKELREKMVVMHRDNPAASVILRSDRLVQFKNIVGILDVLNELGIRNLNIAATQEE